MPIPFAPYADRRLGLVLLAFVLACARSDPPRLKTSLLPGSESATAIRYQLRNVGGWPLALEGVAPICGCAIVAPLPEVLASGASMILDVQCRSSRSDGASTRELRLHTSDPTSPTTVLPITLPGGGPGPNPAALYFGYVRVGESVVRDVVLPAPVALASLLPPAATGLSLEPMPARADAPYGVRVRLTPNAPGVLRAAIDLGTAGPLPVVAVVHDGLLAFPAEIRVPQGSGSGLPAITLVAIGDEPLAITHVDYPRGLTGDLRTVTPGRQFRLVLRGRVDPGAAIDLRSDTGAPLIAIPVVGVDAGTPTAPHA